MPDWRMAWAICAVGAASYAMRIGGYLAAAFVRETGLASRLLRLAPGNLFVAFLSSGLLHGGPASLVGASAALCAMMAWKQEWAALAAGFAGAMLAASAGLS